MATTNNESDLTKCRQAAYRRLTDALDEARRAAEAYADLCFVTGNVREPVALPQADGDGQT